MKKLPLLILGISFLLSACNQAPVESTSSDAPSTSDTTSVLPTTSEEPTTSSSLTPTTSTSETQDVDVILLAGQSNAEGHTHVSELQKKDILRYNTYLKGVEDIQIAYNCDRGKNQSDGFTSVHLGEGVNASRFGPEIGMAETLMNQTDLKRKVMIIKYAVGGTNLYSQWRSPSSSGSQGELYEKFILYVNDMLANIEDMGYNPHIRALCWMQGESDATDSNFSSHYQEVEKNFFADVSEFLEDYLDEDTLPIIDAYISDYSVWANYQIINAAKKANADENPNHYIIDTLGANLDYRTEPSSGVDYFHYDSLSMISLGNLFAQSVLDNILK